MLASDFQPPNMKKKYAKLEHFFPDFSRGECPLRPLWTRNW